MSDEDLPEGRRTDIKTVNGFMGACLGTGGALTRPRYTIKLDRKLRILRNDIDVKMGD